MYFVCFYFILHSCIIVSTGGGVGGRDHLTRENLSPIRHILLVGTLNIALSIYISENVLVAFARHVLL